MEFKLTEGHEFICTRVDYGSPGGYMLTIGRLEQDDDTKTLVVWVDDTQVARMEDCDDAEATVIELRSDVLNRKGLNPGTVMRQALRSFYALYAASGSDE